MENATVSRARGAGTRFAFGLVERNVVVATKDWLEIATGVVEPVLYLLVLGIGLGRYVGEIDGLPGADAYAAYLAPAMVVTTVMNGSVTEATYSIFNKMRISGFYATVVQTSVTPASIVLGEGLWATVRGTLYGVVLLAMATACGWVDPADAMWAVPCLVLIAMTFAFAGLAATTFMRSWQDFDYVNVALTSMFVLSGTFVPVTRYPGWLQEAVSWTPLYQGMVLLRDVAVRPGHPHAAGVVYFVVLGGLCLMAATSRFTRILHR
ncbi:hypothetical protein GCM10027186_18640 [Micromonospora schwarzwaldensis]